MGAVTGTEGLRITHMLYADDLTLTANDPVQLQKMLRRLESYAARKGLTVNVQKFYLVNFNAYRNSAVPVLRLYNQEPEERDYFTYLGMLFDKHMNLHHAATHALRPFNAALRRVKEFGIEKRISDRPHAMSWLFKINICVVSWQVCQSDLVYAISEA
jgi:MarR-like DNA-binding transcriptional regulator SgrR of sgrS sRNA